MTAGGFDIQAFGRQLCSKKYGCECRKTPCRGAAWGKLAHINGGKCDRGRCNKVNKKVNKDELGGV